MIRIPEKLRKQVAKNADFKCEYCLTPEFFLATTFHVDHIRSVKHGGQTSLENLAYACPQCNRNKGSDIASYTAGEQIKRFFNPRIDNWSDHFSMLFDGEITHYSDIGEVTSRTFNFNQEDKMILRKSLIEIGVISSQTSM